MKSSEFIKENSDSGSTGAASVAAGPAQNLLGKPAKKVKETAKPKAKAKTTEGRMVKGPGGVPLGRDGKPLPVKASSADRRANADKVLDTVWRKVESIVGQIFPDGDPIDYVVP